MRSTTPQAIWGAIEAAMYSNKCKKEKLAKAAGVHLSTVFRDASDPSHIPLGRLCLYCQTLKISPDVIATMITSGVCG